MTQFHLIVMSLVCLAVSSGAVAQQPPTPGELGVVADHHLHLRTPTNIEAMVAFNQNMAEALRDPSINKDMAVVDADHVIEELDKAGIQYGTILSSAYFFGMPEVVMSDEDRYNKTKSANDEVAKAVSRHPKRLKAFCGISPLSSFAKTEVTRCIKELGMTGLKLHFANADIDLLKAEHIQSLASFFKHVHSLSIPVVLHIRTRNPGFGRADIESFIEKVLKHTPGLELYIAHLSGWGGYDPNTDAALTAWADALENGDIENPDAIHFDIAATVTRHPNEANKKIAELVRRIGAERFFIGSDWPAFNQPRWVPVNFRNNVPLTSDEHDVILKNLASYFE